MTTHATTAEREHFSVAADAPYPPSGVSAPVKSLYKYSYLEALRYKWIASEQAGRDLGDRAIAEWLSLYWLRWCRSRWLEHLMGIVYWAEFDPAAFATLANTCCADVLLFDRVLDRVRCGWENLDIILWAADWKLDTDAVIDVLIMLDINRARLDADSLFDPDPL